MHYKSFKVMLEVDSYLKTDLPFLYELHVLANYRCSGHALMIEIGRHFIIDFHVRFCQLC